MISIVVAMDRNGLIGIKGGGLPWRRTQKDDLRQFRELTVRNAIIMGRKTFTDDIKKPLPLRTNIILTRNREYEHDGCITAYGIVDALSKVPYGQNCYIIGGAEVFEQALPIVDTIHVSIIDHEFVVEKGLAIYFPQIDWNEWESQQGRNFPANELNQFAFNTEVRRRKEV